MLKILQNIPLLILLLIATTLEVSICNHSGLVRVGMFLPGATRRYDHSCNSVCGLAID